MTWLFWYTSGLGAFAFSLVVLALVFFALRYRARPGRKAVYDHGTSKGSYAFTGVLALTVFLSIDLVQKALGGFDLGPAAAFSIIYFLIILVLSWLFYTLMMRSETR